VKIAFDNLRNGWVDFKLESEGEIIIQDSFSYTPYYSFFDLVDVLDFFNDCKRNLDKSVVFSTEPYEYEFLFKQRGEEVQLKVLGHKDDRRTDNFDCIFSIHGSYKEVCIPFWRGLRGLQSKYDPQELEEAWNSPFPSAELDELSKTIKAKNA
jgi:hypothetical protein